MRSTQWSALAAVVVMLAACEKKEENTTINADTTAAAAPAAPAPAGDSAAAGAPAGNVQLPAGVTADMVAQGNQIFHGAGNCFTCHGADAKGTQLAPNLTDDQWLNGDGSYDMIVNTVTTGVAQPKQHPAPMPAKGGSSITDDQVKQVAAYVFSISHGGQ